MFVYLFSHLLCKVAMYLFSKKEKSPNWKKVNSETNPWQRFEKCNRSVHQPGNQDSTRSLRSKLGMTKVFGIFETKTLTGCDRSTDFWRTIQVFIKPGFFDLVRKVALFSPSYESRLLLKLATNRKKTWWKNLSGPFL